MLLIAGLSFGIVSIFFVKNAKRKYGLICIISGILLIFCYLIFFLFDVKAEIIVQIFVIVVVLATANRSITIRDKPKSQNSADSQNYIFNWRLFSFWFVTIMFVFIAIARFPSVKIDNGNIRMSGAFGGVFKISDIQSVDTVRFYPRTNIRTFGSGGLGIKKGDYRVRDENKSVKFNIKLNNPPYISIRMNDNRLFIFNFKEPDKTVKFYNQLKNKLNTN